MDNIFSQISKKEYDGIFPFYFVFDKKLKIILAGDGLKKVIPSVINSSFLDVFTIKRPFSTNNDFHKMIQFLNQIFIIESKETKLLFRGQIIHLKENDFVMFIGSPWVLSVDDLKKYGLLITDFSMYDTIPDMLQVMKSQEIVMNDMKLLVSTLNDQKQELEESDNHHYLQYSISQVLLSSQSIKDTMKEIIKLICSHLSFHCGAFWMSIEDILTEGDVKSISLENTPPSDTILHCVSYWQNETIENTEFKKATKSAICSIGNSLPGKIWKTNRINWSYDVKNEDNLSRKPSLATLNLNYALGFPISNENCVLGVFEFYHNNSYEIDVKLMQLFKIAGNQLCYFILKIKSDFYIKESERRYKQIVEEASDIIYKVDIKGYFVYVNPIVKTFLNRKDNEIIGTHFINLVHKSDRRKVWRFYYEQLKNEIALTYLEFLVVNDQNIEKWIGQNTSIIYENGLVTGFQSVGRDITEKKQNEELLIQAKENAEKSKIIKEQFLANMSHEIRTPMNAIIGMSELLNDSDLSNDQREYLDTIKLSSENLLLIINDILDFSKIESGKINFENTPFSINDVVDGVIKTLCFSSEKKGLKLISILSNDIPNVLLGDSLRLRQILINLVSNSIKFTEKGDVIIETKLIENDLDIENYKVFFKVSDTGIGIPKDKISTIFESFTQASNETTRKYGGTGLGLTIVKQLVELQGGNISVSSEINRGSSFTFILTFRKGDIEINKSENNVLSYSYTELNDLRILLAEDNPMNQKVAKMVFNKWKCVLEIAENGKVAIEKLTSNDYDIILMDIQMPEMDGYEATLFIRNNMSSKKSRTPIMAMTAHAMEGEAEKCISLGMNDYISKPFNQKKLFEKIIKLTTKK